MTKHTPGPWVERETAGGTFLVTDEANRLLVGDATFSRDINETRANARLIAAAPELLDALKAILAGLEDMTSEEFANGADRYLRDMARTAILKATGKE